MLFIILAENKIENFLNKKFLESYLYKNHYIPIDWRIITKIKKKLNLKSKGLSGLIEKETSYTYKVKCLQNWTGDKKWKNKLRIRLPILILFSKIINKPNIIPKEYKWIESAYKNKKFEEIRKTYESNNNSI